MTEIVFIRHAATDLAGTFCGHLDPPVNAEGEQQIARLTTASWLTGLRAVYSSDLQRARTTAEAVATAAGVAVTVEAAWRELGFGAWEGLTWREVERLDAAYARRWMAEFPALPAPQGELYSSLCSRVLQAVNRLRTLAGTRVAVVTHVGVMCVLLQELCAVDPARAWQMTRKHCGGFRLLEGNSFEVLR